VVIPAVIAVVLAAAQVHRPQQAARPDHQVR